MVVVAAAVHFVSLQLDDVSSLNDVRIWIRRPPSTDVFDVTRIVRFDVSVLAGSYVDANVEHCSIKYCCRSTMVE